MSRSQTPTVKTKDWLDWYFKADENPFENVTTANEVKAKQNSIENYVRTQLLSEYGPTWSVQCEWRIADSVPLVYNMKATLMEDNSIHTVTAFAAQIRSGIGTPQPPPQPPPPNL